MDGIVTTEKAAAGSRRRLVARNFLLLSAGQVATFVIGFISGIYSSQDAFWEHWLAVIELEGQLAPRDIFPLSLGVMETKRLHRGAEAYVGDQLLPMLEAGR